MKTILITGAAGGIGNAIAMHFAGNNYNLALAYWKQDFDETSMKNASQGKFGKYNLDIQNEVSVQSVIQQIKEDMGSIDILINSAGISQSGFACNIDYNEWQKVMNVNVGGAFLLTKHILPKMIENKYGRIVHIGSLAGQVAIPGLSAYAASKAALEGFTRSVALEVADKNITVNTIAPGYMNTGMLLSIPEKIRAKILNRIPVNHYGNPLEIAYLIEYLISDNASYLTGQTISINGGYN